MSMPARKPQPEMIVEERMARLEVTVEHIQSDVTEVKANLVRLDSKIDRVESSLEQKIDGVRRSLDSKIDDVRSSLERRIDTLDSKIDGVRDSLGSKIDGVRDTLGSKLDAVKDSVEALKRGRLEDKLWALLAMATLLGVMARGFHWI